jgi:hypothetical protein
MFSMTKIIIFSFLLFNTQINIFIKMKVTTNEDESLPIELLQKDFQITEDEIKSHATLKLTVNKINL